MVFAIGSGLYQVRARLLFSPRYLSPCLCISADGQQQNFGYDVATPLPCTLIFDRYSINSANKISSTAVIGRSGDMSGFKDVFSQIIEIQIVMRSDYP